jgi:hypothetical protein
MAKEKTKSVQVFISGDFNLKLKQYMLDLEKINVHRTKAELIVRLAELGLKIENQEIKIDHYE